MSRDSLVRLDSIGAGVRIDVHVDVSKQHARHGESQPPSSETTPSSIPSDPSPHSGHIVGGRYELVRLLGRGSMGAVWLANHTTLGERVALKLMTTTDEASSVEDARTSVARFRFEAQIAARLSRKTRHVVRVTDHGHDGALPYLVMELLEGQTLEKALLCRGPLSVGEVSGLVSQIARGLDAAHAEGVLHRDLKPANVFLADSGEGRPVVKLLDFGVARSRRGPRFAAPFATAKGHVVGTPGYMSPEQAAAVEIDVRSDLWSLAAIAYEALTAELPVAGVDVEDMLSNLRACRTVPLHERPIFPRASIASSSARSLRESKTATAIAGSSPSRSSKPSGPGLRPAQLGACRRPPRRAQTSGTRPRERTRRLPLWRFWSPPCCWGSATRRSDPVRDARAPEPPPRSPRIPPRWARPPERRSAKRGVRRCRRRLRAPRPRCRSKGPLRSRRLLRRGRRVNRRRASSASSSRTTERASLRAAPASARAATGRGESSLVREPCARVSKRRFPETPRLARFVGGQSCCASRGDKNGPIISSSIGPESYVEDGYSASR
jgi:serine/threonine protein kinase